jgi:hypothetical protein
VDKFDSLERFNLQQIFEKTHAKVSEPADNDNEDGHSGN